MRGAILIFLGGGLGAVMRHGVNLISAKALGAEFPFGTIFVNVVGSFAMGILAGWLAWRSGEGWSAEVRLFLATGVLGGFTTFSAFSLDAVTLWERGAAVHALGYAAVSVLLSVAALVVGLVLVRNVT
jgi:CrcB protein